MEDVDVLVVGAGPAGASAAAELARAGLAVWLVERSRFPRAKVCGGCLGAGAVASLERAGSWGAIAPGAAPLHALRCVANGSRFEIPLTGSAAIERSTFDGLLARTAVAAGARFVEGQRVRLAAPLVREPWRRAWLGEGEVELRARLVLDATGLGAGLEPGAAPRVAKGSRIGLGALLDPAAAPLAPGVVEMAVGRAGYVGLVRLADGRLDLAAALDGRALAELGAAGALRELRAAAGLAPLAGLGEARLVGTPALTRAPLNLGRSRRLALGDAGGYVEPFTGEGIAWALLGARLVAELVLERGLEDAPALERAWERLQATVLVPRRRACARFARLLRRPAAVGALLRAARLAPHWSAPLLGRVARWVHRPGNGASAPVGAIPGSLQR